MVTRSCTGTCRRKASHYQGAAARLVACLVLMRINSVRVPMHYCSLRSRSRRRIFGIVSPEFRLRCRICRRALRAQCNLSALSGELGEGNAISPDALDCVAVGGRRCSNKLLLILSVSLMWGNHLADWGLLTRWDCSR
jgi:hypothetical protein